MKKLLSMCVLLCVLFLATNVSAAIVYYDFDDGAPADSSIGSAQNWDPDGYPIPDTADLEFTVIDTGDNATCETGVNFVADIFCVGYQQDPTTTGASRLTINGGTITARAAGDFRLAHGWYWGAPTPQPEAIVDMYDGVVSANKVNISMKGTGTFNLYGGQLRAEGVAGKLNVVQDFGTGTLNIFGGLAYAQQLATTNFRLSRPGNGLVNITDGVLQLMGNQEIAAGDFVTNGLIVGFGGTGTVNIAYDRDADVTNVTAIVPEPATLALLGFGSLQFLRRRNRK